MRNNQSGYILPFTLVVLAILMLVSASFFSRNNDSTGMSAMRRDHDLALMLAESSINRVIGRFYNDDAALYSIGCPSMSMIGDMNCDGLHDNPESRPTSFNPTLPLDVGYQFFASNGNTGITETAPTLLQKIADGEARATGSNLTSQSIATNIQYLRVSDLFVNSSVRPILFRNGSSGLIASTSTWSGETADSKAAVFVEITRNSSKVSWLDLWVCSVAQVGDSKAYGMRYIGSFTDTWGGAIPAPISESANHG